MDETLKESLAGFDALWQRVTGREDSGGAPRSPAGDTYSQEDALLGLIHDESCAAAQAAALARWLQGDGRAVLLRHAADARRHLRRLRAEYFIAAGITDGGGQDCRAAAGKLAGLRAALLQAGDMADRYEKAAERADSPELRDVLAVFSADERRRARETRALLVEMF